MLSSFVISCGKEETDFETDCMVTNVQIKHSCTQFKQTPDAHFIDI